jgi:predicted RNA binding protein YcfA (HicA-like mRNA interferase family)
VLPHELMSKLPVLKPEEVVRILLEISFAEVRQYGSHKQFRDSKGRSTTVPFHKGRDLSPLLLHQIAMDIGMTAEDSCGIIKSWLITVMQSNNAIQLCRFR